MTITYQPRPSARPYLLVFDGVAVARGARVTAWTEAVRGACYRLEDVEPCGVLGRGFWLALTDADRGEAPARGRLKIQDPKDGAQDVTLLPGACVWALNRWVDRLELPLDESAGCSGAVERCLICADAPGKGDVPCPS